MATHIYFLPVALTDDHHCFSTVLTMAAIPMVSAISFVPIEESQTTPLQRNYLPENPPEDDEVNIIFRLKAKTPTIPQTICFTDLPAEIRNRIYSHVLPTEEQELIVATPFEDEA